MFLFDSLIFMQKTPDGTGTGLDNLSGSLFSGMRKIGQPEMTDGHFAQLEKDVSRIAADWPRIPITLQAKFNNAVQGATGDTLANREA